MTDTKKPEPRRWMSSHPGPTREMREVVEASEYDAIKDERDLWRRRAEHKGTQVATGLEWSERMEEKLRIAVDTLEIIAQSQIAIGPEGELETLWEIKFSESIMMALDAIQAIKEIK